MDRPCRVVTYNGSGTNVAETDYLYDGGTSLCGTAGTPSVAAVANPTGHDETNYASTSIAPRGNLTQESRQIIQPAPEDNNLWAASAKTSVNTTNWPPKTPALKRNTMPNWPNTTSGKISAEVLPPLSS